MLPAPKCTCLKRAPDGRSPFLSEPDNGTSFCVRPLQNNETPLMYALEENRLDCAAFLIACGARE